MISSSTFQNDPWIVPDETSIHSFSDRMSLSPIELDYEAIYSACAMHTFSLINWFDRSLDDGTYFDPFSHVFSTDESIMEIMMLDDAPWDDHHLCSTFPGSIEDTLSDVYLPNFIESFMSSFHFHEVNSKNNLSNVIKIIPLDIYVKLGIVENLHIGASCSPSKIKTYKALF